MTILSRAPFQLPPADPALAIGSLLGTADELAGLFLSITHIPSRFKQILRASGVKPTGSTSKPEDMQLFVLPISLIDIRDLQFTPCGNWQFLRCSYHRSVIKIQAGYNIARSWFLRFLL